MPIRAANRYDLQALKVAYHAVIGGSPLVVVSFLDGSPSITYTQADRALLLQKVLFSI